MKTVYMDLKCFGNLTQNHAGIHGLFKDIFQCHIQLRFSMKRPRRRNKIMAQKCTTIIAKISAIYSFGHISFGLSQTIYGRNDLSHISFSPKRLLPYTKGSTVLVLHYNCIVSSCKAACCFGWPPKGRPRPAVLR
jgi:hypothetical protein